MQICISHQKGAEVNAKTEIVSVFAPISVVPHTRSDCIKYIPILALHWLILPGMGAEEGSAGSDKSEKQNCSSERDWGAQ